MPSAFLLLCLIASSHIANKRIFSEVQATSHYSSAQTFPVANLHHGNQIGSHPSILLGLQCIPSACLGKLWSLMCPARSVPGLLLSFFLPYRWNTPEALNSSLIQVLSLLERSSLIFLEKVRGPTLSTFERSSLPDIILYTFPYFLPP